MKSLAPKIARYLLGLIFAVFGAMYFFTPPPPTEGMPEKLVAFTSGLQASVYFMPLLKLTETVCGVLLLAGFAPALALVILAPITINIFFTHLFLTPEITYQILPVVILILHGLAASAYWQKYRPLFSR